MVLRLVKHQMPIQNKTTDIAVNGVPYVVLSPTPQLSGRLLYAYAPSKMAMAQECNEW